MLMVTRLTGYDEEDAVALIDKATESFFNPPDLSAGQVIIDRGSGSATYHEAETIEALNAWGYPVIDGDNSVFITDQSNLVSAFSWGSNDRRSPASYLWSLQFVPGAIMDTAVSSCGRTFNVHRVGGLSRLQNGSWSKWTPQTKEDLPKTNINRIVKVGDLLYCGSGGYANNTKIDPDYAWKSATAPCHVSVWTASGLPWRNGWRRYVLESNKGVPLLVYDFDGDGADELVALDTRGGTGNSPARVLLWNP